MKEYVQYVVLQRNNINLNMNKDIISNDKRIIFKQLIIEYLIKNIIGDTNGK